MTTETLTWFGGHAGVMWNADRALHLIESDGTTYCKIRAGLRPVTRREANSDRVKMCPTCLARAQEAGR